MSATPSAKPRRFGAGDGIRGLACLYVVLHHVARHTGTLHLHDLGRKAGDPIGQFGDTGSFLLWGARATPYIFFTLSGYLLARPFARAILGGGRKVSVRRYARSRFLRIVPAFWLAWTLTFLVEGTHHATVKDIVLDYSFLQTSHPNPGTALMVQGWTLSVELGFYFALPLAAVALWYLIPRMPREFSRGTWMLIILGLGGLVSLGIRSEWGNPVWKAMFPEYLIAFTPGLMLAVGEQMWAEKVRGSHAVRQVIPLLIAGAVLALMWHASLVGGDLLNVSISGTLVAACLVGGALLHEWNTGGKAWRFFANPVSDWIGERSYGIYLLHYLILRQTAGVAGGIDSVWLAWLVRASVAVPATLLAADLSYRFLERPVMNWRKEGRKPAKAPPSQPEMIAP
jgi:peptidoglycan/LPS O-acetylase OafA/YrhL